jgi:hypothetical protein
MYRQGDVLLVPTTVPDGLTTVPTTNGRLILAEGEATGHHHSVDASVATLGTRDDVMYLTVEELTEVRHQEHAPITLPAGGYRVVRQREYTPERIRNVAD